MTILDEKDPRVGRQIELARALLSAEVPCFGSCWAIQLASVASGGRCERNPSGREFGISKQIRVSSAGREHPLFAGKPAEFTAFTSHVDHVADLPTGSTTLASNDWTPIQAANVAPGRVFWAVQYHPEYDLHEIASLCRMRLDALVADHTFADERAARQWLADLEALHRSPGDESLRDKLGVDESLLDPRLRSLEVDNWLRLVVAP